MRVRAGLCSVTLRALPWHEVLQAAVTAGLDGIEWGADVHLPPGELERAAEIAERSARNGIAVTSYGSYFVAGVSPGSEVEPLIATARAVGAPRIRVWAGAQGSMETGREARARVVGALRDLTDAAQHHGIVVGLEYHGGTLTDSAGSTERLLDEVARPTLSSYWQPPVGMPDAAAVADLRRLLPRVCAVHAFSWWPATERLPLRGRAGLWRDVLEVLGGRDRDGEGDAATDLLMEFVAGDDTGRLHADARDLLEWTGRGHRRPSPTA